MKMELRSRAIDKVYKRRDRIEIPDFQREEVWSIDKKQLLIDSILKGWHIPKFYFRKMDENSFECVDGQQRLNAIIEFFEDTLPLASDTAKRVRASKYSELPDDVQDEFDDYEIEIEEIENASDDDLEELFKRLQLGMPLNTAEKLNAVSGDMSHFCRMVSRSAFFSDRIALRNTRYAHLEIATRWLFIEARSLLPQVRFPQLESFLRDNRTFDSHSDTARRVSRALEYLEEAFPKKCDALRSRANVLSICMLASKVVAQKLDRNTAATFGDFVTRFFDELASEVEKGRESTDKELFRYQQAISAGSADAPSIKARINILTKRLAAFALCFAPLLGAYADAETDAIKSLIELSENAKELIHRVNGNYSSVHGEDLFRMTNESVAGLNRLGIPCKDSALFGDFVDALYFLVYEGSGSCNRLPTPAPDFAMDVKHMRTSIRHDIDHGDPVDIRKKRIRIAEVFKAYSGKASLGECSPEEIFLAQLRIMEKMVAFLKSLC